MILRDFKTFVETLQWNVSTPRFIHLISNAKVSIALVPSVFWVNTFRLREKGEAEKEKEKPLTQTQYPFPKTQFQVKNA